MKNYCGHQILLGQWYLGPLLICMWTLAWSYKLDFKLHLVYPLLALMHLPRRVFPPLSLCFPVHTLYISSPKVFSNPEKFTHFFLLLSLVSGGNHHSFPTSHIFPCLSKSQGILTSLRIPLVLVSVIKERSAVNRPNGTASPQSLPSLLVKI